MAVSARWDVLSELKRKAEAKWTVVHVESAKSAGALAVKVMMATENSPSVGPRQESVFVGSIGVSYLAAVSVECRFLSVAAPFTDTCCLTCFESRADLMF